jgi:hypothetical protein
MPNDVLSTMALRTRRTEVGKACPWFENSFTKFRELSLKAQTRTGNGLICHPMQNRATNILSCPARNIAVGTFGKDSKSVHFLTREQQLSRRAAWETGFFVLLNAESRDEQIAMSRTNYRGQESWQSPLHHLLGQKEIDMRVVGPRGNQVVLSR